MECEYCTKEIENDDPLEKQCDYCRKGFNISVLCGTCYYKHYPLRLCAKCIPLVEAL